MGWDSEVCSRLGKKLCYLHLSSCFQLLGIPQASWNSKICFQLLGVPWAGWEGEFVLVRYIIYLFSLVWMYMLKKK